MDSLILCKFLRGVFPDLFAAAAEMLRLVAGWDATAAELRLTAARIVAARKLFNLRCGWTPDEDTLPARLLARPLNDDPDARLSADSLVAAVRAYNLARGYSPQGVPTGERLASLALADL
jgi:aldehyde:ferredoxin oxidoreductase